MGIRILWGNTCYCTPMVSLGGSHPTSKLTFHCDIIHRQLQALASSHHLHSVPLVVIQFLSRQQHLWSFACHGEGGERIQNHKQHSRERCVHTTHPSTHPQAVVHTRRATVLEEKTHVCQQHSHFGFSQDSENGRNQICSLTDCKIGCLLKSSQCCSKMSSKTLGQISRYQLRE